ncbi:rhamnogalacturonidase [Sphingobacterium suaedae]|uniref:Glycoside hydrolase family 28 protein n=1 Tax=Sphingobacterium suaedae TaxID=1686402 RepID=A0ABW5KI17_9SPHI
MVTTPVLPKNFIFIRIFFLLYFLSSFSSFAQRSTSNAIAYDVRNYGAKGDGKHVDHHAINRAIEAANQAGGGTVLIPAGRYLCFSIRLKSYITLQIDAGATIVAAHMDEHDGQYDDPEPNPWGELQYQDFGHSHFRNSLIWGENLTDISIIGPGLIYGKGLQKWGDRTAGLGNKSIALKACRNVILRDFSILQGGHFGILATGVDNITISNLKIDTNRDAIDIDGCRHVRISDCLLNSPNDDALVLKSSYALGRPLPTEHVTIQNCSVYGYDEGSFLDGTFQTTQKTAPDKGVVTGRIKFGTESNGAFRHITISNCTFEHCRGLALETVDGAILENITVSNIVMHDILNAPFFFRLGSRMRGPKDISIGTFRRILVDNVIITASNPTYGSMLMGIPGHEVEDIQFSNIWIRIKGGGTAKQARTIVPELETAYPDPQEFGDIPAYGFFIRHAKRVYMNNIRLEFEQADWRPAFILEDVKGAYFTNITVQCMPNIPRFVLKDVFDFLLQETSATRPVRFKKTKSRSLL